MLHKGVMEKWNKIFLDKLQYAGCDLSLILGSNLQKVSTFSTTKTKYVYIIETTKKMVLLRTIVEESGKKYSYNDNPSRFFCYNFPL